MADQADAGGFPVSGPAAAHLRVGPEVQQAAHHQADREHGAPRQGEHSRDNTLAAAYRIYTLLPILAPTISSLLITDSSSIVSVAEVNICLVVWDCRFSL